ncbi:hypothetical protein [Mucilaginibacter sp. UYCu711]|uniref:hypothetical protein n=1 Tax=Mucilaginibacter sp. UYCu711 TaxID=3156339 RepID=UPI003D20F477
MRRFKLNLALATFIAGSAIAITQSSFTPAKAAKFSSNYHFKGTTTAQMKTAANYEVVTSPPTCDNGGSLPCEIDNISGSLQTWLDARTNAQILAAAVQTKN